MVIPLLWGCEKYELQIEPKLTGGKWVFVDYDIVVISSISNATPIENDTICINSFNEQSFLSGNIVMKQNYNLTATDRRFIKGKTTWEFDSNNTQLYCDYTTMLGNPKPNPHWVSLINNYKKQLIEIQNQSNGNSTTYTYDVNSYGANPPTLMKLLSPEIVTDLYLSNGTRDKAVTVRVLLTFMR